MADETQDFDTISVDQLDTITLALEQYLSVANVNGKLFKSKIADFLTFITPYVSAFSASSYVPVTGTVLPNNTSAPSQFTFVGAGTFTQTTGGSITTTSLLNILGWNGTTWSLVKAIDTTAFLNKIDYNYGGRFATVAAANGAITNAVGSNGLNNRDAKRVDIGTAGNYVPYWWSGGFADANLVKFIPDGKTAVWIAQNYGSDSVVSYLGKYWRSNAAVLSTDIPGTSTKWVEELTAYNTDEIKKRTEKNIRKVNNVVRLMTPVNLTYSDANVGNLGTPFTLSFLTQLNYVAATLPIFQKGDYAVDGWGINVTSTGLYLVVKNVSTLLTTSINDYNIFLSIVSDATSTRVYGYGKLITTITDTTSSSIAIKTNTSYPYQNSYLHYLSIDSRALTIDDINKEIDVISDDYSIIDLGRDFVGNSTNLSTSGYVWKDKSYSGTAVIIDKPYLLFRRTTDILSMQRDMTVAKQTLSSLGKVNEGGATTISTRITNLINISDYTSLNLVNALDYSFSYNIFYDKNTKPLSIIQSGTSNTPTIVSSKVLVIPFGAVYFKGVIGNGGYVVGLGKYKIEKPVIQRRPNKEALSIERVAPVIYDGIFNVESSQTPTTIKVFTVVSFASNSMTLSSGDFALFPLINFYYPLAILDSNGKYHFDNVSVDSANGVLKFEKTINYTPVKFMSVHNTTQAGQGQHLSHYGYRALAERVVESVTEYSSYKNNGQVGFNSEDSSLFVVNTTEFKLADDQEQPFADLTIGNGCAILQVTTNDELAYKGGLAGGNAIDMRGNGIGDIATIKTRVPFKNGFLEMIILNPIGTLSQSGYVAISTANLIITNNGVEIYNQLINPLRYEKILLNRSDWGDVTARIVVNNAGNYIVYFRSMIFFKSDPNAKYYPIDSSSIVAVLGDSWTQFSGTDDPLIEAGDDKTPLITASTGLPVAGVIGHMPKWIATRTGAVVDNWGKSGMTAVWGYAQMWEILNRKRYTHMVIEFFTNDNVQGLSREWEAYLRIMVRMCVAAGVQPVVISPMGTASDSQRRAHGTMSFRIRRGLFDAY